MPSRSAGGSSELRSSLPLGPSWVVAAAIVSPVTLLAAATAGLQYGPSLWWLVLLVTAASIVLQEMAARLATLTGIGLGEMLRRQFRGRWTGAAMMILVVLGIGCAGVVYQTGNLLGGGWKVDQVLIFSRPAITILIAIVASGLLWFGSYRTVERVLIVGLSAMGILLVAAATIAVARGEISPGQWVPRLPSGSWPLGLALIPSMLLPYNLFLHASGARERWAKIRPRGAGVRRARIDTLVGISAAGILTIAVMILFASFRPAGGEATSPEVVDALRASVGSSVTMLMVTAGVAGLGLTSAVAAPLGAAYAISGICGWQSDADQWRFRSVWMGVMVLGVAGSLTGVEPGTGLLVTLAVSAVLLPLVSLCLLAACNAKILGQYANTPLGNAVAALAITAATTLTWAALVSYW